MFDQNNASGELRFSEFKDTDDSDDPLLEMSDEDVDSGPGKDSKTCVDDTVDNGFEKSDSEL